MDEMLIQAEPVGMIADEREQSTAQTEALHGMPILIPVPRAAELLGISRSAAYRCAASGDLPTTHMGGRVYVITARLRALLESA